VSVEDLRRWIEARRAGAEQERAEARRTPVVTDPIQAALGLIAFAGALNGWPPIEDPVSVREDAAMYERWVRLRQQLSRRSPS
jgi:hypothetical protein